MARPLPRPRGGWLDDLLVDEEVVRRVLAGRTELFELLLRRHAPRLYRVVRAVAADDEEAGELLQLACVSAWRGLGRRPARRPVVSWLARVALRIARDAAELRRRRGGGARRGSPGPAASAPLAGRAAREAERARRIEAALDALSEPYRSVFSLRVLEGLSTEEAALDLGLTEAAVKIRLHRARAMLPAELAADLADAAVLARVWALGQERRDRLVAGVLGRISALPPAG